MKLLWRLEADWTSLCSVERLPASFREPQATSCSAERLNVSELNEQAHAGFKFLTAGRDLCFPNHDVVRKNMTRAGIVLNEKRHYGIGHFGSKAFGNAQIHISAIY